jgi:DNA mismatch repair protein MutL
MQNLPTIRLLPSELQNQIAAGEVVERPSSVLKELIENALDAQSTRIAIQIADGGQAHIKISDNGHGIAENELSLAVTRHATSKLSRISDLQFLNSFGFRGEALPSIASVSRFRIQSAQNSGEGSFLEILHGRVVHTGRISMPQGTTIEMRDLFSNTPARLKFLKKSATESRKCAEVVLRLALAHLDVEFEFMSSDRKVFHFLTGQTLRQRLACVWPSQIVDYLHDIKFEDNKIIVNGLTGDPSTAQSRADKILIYVNRRPVQDKTVISAVRDAYKGLLLGNEYPQALLFINIPTEEVDINVHPAKSEVRFQDEGVIFRTVRQALSQTLSAHYNERFAHARPLSDPKSPPFSQPHLSTLTDPLLPTDDSSSDAMPSQDQQKFISSKSLQMLFDQPALSYQTHTSVPTNLNPQHRAYNSELKYLGQLASMYLIIHDGDSIILIDQHAAHERILYDSIRNESAQSRQPLLVPFEIQLHPAQASHIQNIWTELLNLGFSIELATELTLVVSAIPGLLTLSTAKDFLNDVLIEKKNSLSDLWALMACRSAIKAGDSLTADEALSLIEMWSNLPDRFHCPHGRPTAIQWNIHDLDKMFKRRK